MHKIQIGIAGGQGRMGRTLLQEILHHPGACLSAVSVRQDDSALLMEDGTYVTPTTDPEILFEKSEVVIDFTTPEATHCHVRLAHTLKKPLVICTTGLNNTLIQKIKEAALHTPIMVAPNTSIGVTILRDLVQKAAQLLGPDFDIEILETHHKHKKDAPSGTAFYLQEALPHEVPIHSLRLGGVPGDHTVVFANEAETLSLTHRALNRSLFAKGALQAAFWLVDQKPGLYGMKDLLEKK